MAWPGAVVRVARRAKQFRNTSMGSRSYVCTVSRLRTYKVPTVGDREASESIVRFFLRLKHDWSMRDPTGLR